MRTERERIIVCMHQWMDKCAVVHGGAMQWVDRSMAVPAGRYRAKRQQWDRHWSLRPTVITSAEEVMISPESVCLSVFFPVNGITQKLLTISLRNFTERLDIIQGPIDYILSDLDPRKGHWRSKGLNCFLRITSFKIVIESWNKKKN